MSRKWNWLYLSNLEPQGNIIKPLCSKGHTNDPIWCRCSIVESLFQWSSGCWISCSWDELKLHIVSQALPCGVGCWNIGERVDLWSSLTCHLKCGGHHIYPTFKCCMSRCIDMYLEILEKEEDKSCQKENQRARFDQ